MKNKIYRFASIVAAGVIISSCTFLDVEPTVQNPNNFYENEQALRYGLAGVYGPMGLEGFYGVDYSIKISNSDDLSYFNRNNPESRPEYYNFSSSDATVNNTWTAIYGGIKNANEYLAAIANSPFDKNKIYYAEAKFLRAYYHFVLAQSWGDIPVRDEGIKLITETDIAATPQSDVLKWCVSEMEECVNQYFKTDSVTIAPSRVTRSTAEGILARVYLFMAGATVKGVDKTEMYTKAAFWSGEVIKGGKHRLNPDYKQVFINMIEDKYDTEFRESMWEVEFLGDRSNDKEWSNGRIGDVLGLQSTSSTNNFSEWSCNYSYAMYNGSLKLWELYWNTDRTDKESATPTEISDVRQVWNTPVYNYAGGNRTIDGVVVAHVASIDKTPYVGKNQAGVNTQTFSDPTINAGLRNAGKWRREAIYEGHKKAKSLYTTINFPLLRYADVVLMYAEAQNELAGPSQEIYDHVKSIRDRAKISTKDFGDYSDQGAMRTLIRNERARELAFEGIRRYDLIRWGIFYEAIKQYTTYTKSWRWGAADNSATVAAEFASKNVQPKNIYLPIPTSELGVNKKIYQHPMWR